MAKRAVLIGINAYQDDGVSDLAGCLNDIELVTDVLTTHHGFDAAGITTLVDPDTTRDQILSALDALVDATEQGDVALIYYSGHGSQAPDASGDETDPGRYDETIVPSDSGRSDGFPVRDIVDDELNSFVTALAARTDRATFIFDSCHSGSVDRGALAPVGVRGAEMPRAIPAADRAPEGPRHIRRDGAQADGAPSATGMVRQGGYVLIAGCRDDQTSKETLFEGRRHGALTYFLMGALAGGQVSVREAFEQAVEGVKASVHQQDPVLEGPDERLAGAPFGEAVASA